MVILKSKTETLLTIILMGLPFALLVWLFGDDFFRLPCYVFSGRLFVSSWNRIHAGGCLDQPTIGKFYFWFTVVMVITFGDMAIVRKLISKRTQWEYWIFMSSVTILCLFLLCLLTIPFYWLIQYVGAMGWTDTRLYGLFYGIGGYIIVLCFYLWAVIVKRKIGQIG